MLSYLSKEDIIKIYQYLESTKGWLFCKTESSPEWDVAFFEWFCIMVSTLGDYDINSLNKLWSTVTNERHRSFNYNSVQHLGEQEPVVEKFNLRLFDAGEIIMAALNISLGIELIKKLVSSWICQFVHQKNDKNLRLDLNWYFEGNFDHYKVFILLHQLGLRGNRFAVVLYNGLC